MDDVSDQAVPLPSATASAARDAERRRLVLQRIQPGLIGLIDGTISTLAPIFAAAYIAGSRAALLVGLASALGAAISMGLSEGLSDDGSVTGRGSSMSRGLITGGATFLGGTFHALPFIISDVSTALAVAYVVVSVELVAIAVIRRRFMQVPLPVSLVQVTLGGALVAIVGVLVGHA
jgi:VIT1/CCC1 family predicted Fe2+/Mn2+ transporter